MAGIRPSDGQQRIDDRDAARISERAARRARRGEAPQAEQDVDDIVQRVHREQAEQHAGWPRHVAAIGRLDQLRHEAGDAGGDEDDAEDQCERARAHPALPVVSFPMPLMEGDANLGAVRTRRPVISAPVRIAGGPVQAASEMVAAVSSEAR